MLSFAQHEEKTKGRAYLMVLVDSEGAEEDLGTVLAVPAKARLGQLPLAASGPVGARPCAGKVGQRHARDSAEGSGLREEPPGGEGK